MVVPGDPFRPKASEWTSMLRAAQQLQNGTHPRAIEPEIAPHYVLLRLKNSSTAIERNKIVGLGQPWKLPSTDSDQFRREPLVIGANPTAAGLFGVTHVPTQAGEFSTVVVGGPAICQIDVTDAAHTFAAPINNDTAKLRSSGSVGPARIIWKESGTGTKWALIYITQQVATGNPRAVHYSMSSPITLSGTSATVLGPWSGPWPSTALDGLSLSYSSGTYEWTNSTALSTVWHVQGQARYNGSPPASLHAVEIWVSWNTTIPPASPNWTVSGYQSARLDWNQYSAAGSYRGFTHSLMPSTAHASGRQFRVMAQASGSSVSIDVICLLTIQFVADSQ